MSVLLFLKRNAISLVILLILAFALPTSLQKTIAKQLFKTKTTINLK